MTRRLAFATLAVAQPMGQQVYEHQIRSRAAGRLGPDWSVSEVTVRSLRSPLPGTVRIPSRVLTGASPAVRRVVGRAVYRGQDLVHRLDLRLPPAPRPEVLTIHDVVSWRYADEGRVPADAAASARRAVAVICPSQFSADEVASLLGVRAPVAIHNGIDPRFGTATSLDGSRLEALGVRQPFVLHAGGCTERKNLAGLAAAWQRVHGSRPDVQLVLAGPPDGRRDRLFGPLAGTVRTGRLDDAVVPGLMAAASVVVVPSLYEGFGLPALEAMAAGVPVVASARGSLPEVCGQAAYLVEPDGPGLAGGIEAALGGGPEVATMVERGRERAAHFTWEASMAAHAEVWRSAAG